MAVPFEKILDGAVRFMNEEIVPGMNDWQEIAARIAIGRIYETRENLQAQLAANGLVRAFAIMDAAGNVDAERLLAELRRELERKGRLQIAVPGFGKFTFMPADVDKLRRHILEG